MTFCTFHGMAFHCHCIHNSICHMMVNNVHILNLTFVYSGPRQPERCVPFTYVYTIKYKESPM